MTSAERQTLARKLEYLRKQLESLERFRSLGKADILNDLEKHLAVERLLELCIQSVIDCSRLMVIVEDWRPARDDRDALDILVERGVLTRSLADRLLRAKAFRNILVHEYVEIDYDLLYDHLRNDAEDLVAFSQALAAYLKEEQPNHGSDVSEGESEPKK